MGSLLSCIKPTPPVQLPQPAQSADAASTQAAGGTAASGDTLRVRRPAQGAAADGLQRRPSPAAGATEPAPREALPSAPKTRLTHLPNDVFDSITDDLTLTNFDALVRTYPGLAQSRNPSVRAHVASQQASTSVHSLADVALFLAPVQVPADAGSRSILSLPPKHRARPLEALGNRLPALSDAEIGGGLAAFCDAVENLGETHRTPTLVELRSAASQGAAVFREHQSRKLLAAVTAGEPVDVCMQRYGASAAMAERLEVRSAHIVGFDAMTRGESAVTVAARLGIKGDAGKYFLESLCIVRGPAGRALQERRITLNEALRQYGITTDAGIARLRGYSPASVS